AVAAIVRGFDIPPGGIPWNGLRGQVHAACGTALPELACRYGTNVPYLMALNFLDEPVLSPGQKLIVPEMPATGAATATPCSANPWT
ncbi:LysM peptidoglycan-binding domain-containing protein, partial [Streptomyces sp. NPDC006265]|uniref:LysM peptidoglycan-binding domain-containing protein n=1 Tax=Streptomyces sp. NPDC006265 TaxID=3156740 RepID=UPI0033B214C2